jgi:amphi-Trp domain-containing protein
VRGPRRSGRIAAYRKEPFMEIVEIEEKQVMRREEAAARLRAIADELASGNSVRLEKGGLRFTTRVPDEVQLKLEFEFEEDKAEFEIELTW